MFGLWEDGAKTTAPEAPLAKSLRRWVIERCRFLDEYWTPMRDLHADFARSDGCDLDLDTFRRLLDEAGVETETTSRGTVWCYGLVLVACVPPEIAEQVRPCLLEGHNKDM